MVALILFLLLLLASPFKSKGRLEAENAVPRQQLNVLQRKVKGRPRLTNTDGWFFVRLYRWFPSILEVVTIFRPETLVGWHRSGFRRCWRWKSGRRVGRPRVQTESACAHTANERREPAVGRTSHPWRTAQAQVRCFSVKRRQIHAQATGTAKSGLARLSGQSCSGYRRDGFVRGPDDWL